MNNSRSHICLMITILGLASMACNLSQAGAPTPTVLSEEDIRATVAAELASAGAEGQPPTATEPAPEQTATPTETPTITPSPTDTTPYVTVSQDTNCRTGPGVVYDFVYALLVGVQAEVVATSSVANYLIIEIPNGSSDTCWLWMQYGVLTGSTEGLPQATPPPTPTPAGPTPEFSLSYHSSLNCSGNTRVVVRLTNTGDVKIESRQVSTIDLDTSISASSQSNAFGASAVCLPLAKLALDPGGDSGYIWGDFTPPVGGHTVRLTVEACAGDGLAEPCSTEQLEYTFPAISDINAKEGFAAVNSQAILDQLRQLQVTRWAYRDSERQGSHIGPMAQDFNRLFGVGEYDDTIQSVDADGVALAAIKGLLELNDQQASRLAELEAENQALSERLARLETRTAVPDGLAWVLSAFALLISAAAIATNRQR